MFINEPSFIQGLVNQ